MAGRYENISSFDAEQAGREQPAPQIFQMVILPNQLCMKNGQQRFFVDKKTRWEKIIFAAPPAPKIQINHKIHHILQISRRFQPRTGNSPAKIPK